MKKNNILLICFLLLFGLTIYSCDKKKPDKDVRVKVFSLIKTSHIDSSFYLTNKLLLKISRSFDAQHYAFSNYEGKYISSFLNLSGDSVIIFDGTRILKIRVPFKYKVPIASLYFHNYDSIFVFLDREFVAKYSMDSFIIDDFILINSKGKLIDRYSLNGFPYIYNGQLNPMVFLKKSFVKNKRLNDNFFYLPFSIYLPNISDYELREINPSLLCKYDLKKHIFSPLNIHIPPNDIGNHYSEDVSTNSIDFYLLNDSTIIYTFDYSPVIYGYNLLKDSTYILNLAEEFLFCNDTDSNNANRISVFFSCPVFNKKYKMFTRLIKVKNYKNYKPFEITQFFDTTFSNVGFVFSDSLYTSVYSNSKGNFIISDKTNNYLSYIVEPGKVLIKSIRDIEEEYLVEKEVFKTKKKLNNRFDKKYKDRLSDYLKSLELINAKKVVLINTDIMCSHCIDFLMNELKRYSDTLKSRNLKYVFFGRNIRFAEELMKEYQISSFELVVIDTKNNYLSYIRADEYSKDPFIVCRENEFKIFTYEPNKIKEVFVEFINY